MGEDEFTPLKEETDDLMNNVCTVSKVKAVSSFGSILRLLQWTGFILLL